MDDNDPNARSHWKSQVIDALQEIRRRMDESKWAIRGPMADLPRTQSLEDLWAEAVDIIAAMDENDPAGIRYRKQDVIAVLMEIKSRTDAAVRGEETPAGKACFHGDIGTVMRALRESYRNQYGDFPDMRRAAIDTFNRLVSKLPKA